MNETSQTSAPEKKVKSQGPIRFELILPISLILGLCWAYFYFFFDGHLRRGLEWVGYHTIGAEVNVTSLRSSFWDANVRIQDIQITNPDKPTYNMISIGDIRFSVLWDGLLRARLVVNEMAVEQVGIDTPRRKPGKVKPPPPPEESEGPSALEEKAKELGDKALDQVQARASNNILGDIAAILGGTNANDQLKAIEDKLPSKAKANELGKGLQERQSKWDAKMKTLPQGKDIQSLADRLKRIKTNNFKTPEELMNSIQEFQKISQEADALVKTISGANEELKGDLEYLETGVKELDSMIKADLKDLETRFRIPSLDAKDITQGVLKPYLDPYIAKINYYKGLAEKYVPPKYLKKNQEKDPEPEFQPHPRAQGITYEFGRKNHYPLFWIKKISVSSTANASLGIGDLSGSITDIASNQAITNKPTLFQFKGDFPANQISGFRFTMAIDTRGEKSKINYDLGIAGYPVESSSLVQSNDVQIKLEGSQSSIESNGQLLGLKNFEISMKQNLRQAKFTTSAKNEIVANVIQKVFAGLPEVFLQVRGWGDLPKVNLSMESNLGTELARGLQAQVALKIEEAKKKIELAVNEAVGKERARIEGEVQKLKAQLEGELKKLQTQLDEKKKEGEAKAEQVKRETEDKAKQQQRAIEEDARKMLKKEGQKALDDLKKKFGL